MTTKRIILIILCVLLALVLILTGILLGKIGNILGAINQVPGDTPKPTTGTSPTVPSTIPSTAPSTSPSTVPTIGPAEHQHTLTLVSSVEATCKGHGSSTYLCQCGYIEMEQTPALGCSFDHGQMLEPTCTEYGCTRFICTRCGEFDDINIVPALGHQWDEGTAKPAGCTDDACTEYHCTVPNCDGILYEDIQEGTATGHFFSAWQDDSNGDYVRTCQICAATQNAADLRITQTISSVVTDVNQVTYTLYEFYVGTEESPSLYRYWICDYINSDMVIYRYDPDQGLVVVL